ncbi:Transcriptional regulator containing PAS, AAA-type ATPase, and DNA-binding Fis domains [Pseudoxanthobacter soli DSM 19599]|uniref:Transcriptional regulator containing PAS, AAA-type ATPase, and DNA-binding Fis domains n=1 Tax=Pseudoxanthobacter soli DSM 19599 TaxID=1123029 RepID=A0A1M7ZIW3_9HYPH|nr:sigma 54-interacting transcriptional regulator [Pseudoxanthobacter soli]SHO64762.1 Transcriptional regulator containing PAS, AAA-type ATPase, and DNA-binding Fis domains [Pseudoxanthobacter soli DSM 19599]
MKFYASDINTLSHRRLRPGFIDDPQFGTFLDALPDGAALIEADGRIKLVNGKLELLLNLARGDLVGSELAKHARTAGPVIQKLSTALQQLKRVEISGTLTSQRNVIATLSILRTGDGGAFGALLTMREASRPTRAEGSDNFRFETEAGIVTRTSFVRTGAIDRIIAQAEIALQRGATVLLTGETGTGKSEIARLIAGGNDGAAFVHVRCGLLGDAQFDVEMFGIEPGSALDTSTRGKLGYVEAADGGTLFLDQVSDLSLAAQARLVAFLESQTFSRLGSAQRRQVRLRIIAATNETLAERVSAGTFRKDLYYRLAVMPFELPPLRAQPELIDALIDQHLRSLNLGRKPQLRLSPELSAVLRAHPYPGNVRELTNVLERIGATAGEVARVEHFSAPEPLGGLGAPPAAASAGPDDAPRNFKDLIQAFETWVLEKSIAEHGSKRSAAKALGIDIATLVRKTRRQK